MADNTTTSIDKWNGSPLVYLPLDLGAKMKQCDRYVVDDADFALYALADLKEADLQTICATVKSIFTRNVVKLPQADVADLLFPTPGWNSLTRKNLGELVVYHVAQLDTKWNNCKEASEPKLPWYPYDFVVATSKDWQSDGLVLVHCERGGRDDLFTVDSCRMPVKDVGLSLTTLRGRDDTFQNLKRSFEIKPVG